MWKTLKLIDIVNIEIGKTPSRNNPKYWDKNKKGSNVWLSIRDMSKVDELYIGDSKEYISDEGAKLFKEVPKNTLIMSFKLSIGKLAITKINLRTNEAIAALKIKDATLVSNKYLYYFLSSMNWDRLAGYDIKVKGKTLNKAKLKEILITLPPLIEQNRIVAKLDAAFAGIDKTLIATNNNIKNTEKLFQSYLTEVFKHGSKDWKIYSIKELGKVITGSTPKTSVAENYGDFISFVKPGDFKTDGSIDFEKQKLSKIGMSKSRVVEKKSSLMVCIGATIGKSGYTDIDIVTNQQINSITPTSKFNYKFIYYQMLTSEFQKKVMNSYGQATLPIINKSKWQSLTMKLPSIDEQLEMVKTLDNLRIETDILKNKLLTKTNELSSLKLSILRQGLAGELAQVA